MEIQINVGESHAEGGVERGKTEALKKLKVEKAFGISGITSAMLKMCGILCSSLDVVNL